MIWSLKHMKSGVSTSGTVLSFLSQIDQPSFILGLRAFNESKWICLKQHQMFCDQPCALLIIIRKLAMRWSLEQVKSGVSTSWMVLSSLPKRDQTISHTGLESIQVKLMDLPHNILIYVITLLKSIRRYGRWWSWKQLKISVSASCIDFTSLPQRA